MGMQVDKTIVTLLITLPPSRVTLKFERTQVSTDEQNTLCGRHLLFLLLLRPKRPEGCSRFEGLGFGPSVFSLGLMNWN